jgi:hypothetical protein
MISGMTTGVINRGRTVKLSTTLPAADLDFLESYSNRHKLPSRAAGFHAAIKALREQELYEQYLAADREWYDSGNAAAWNTTTGDGVQPE